MHSTSKPTHPAHSFRSIQSVLTEFERAEARRQRRLGNILVRARVHTMNRRAGASFFWLQDGDDGCAIEVVVRAHLHRIIPARLSAGDFVEVRGDVTRFRGSAPQIEARWIQLDSAAAVQPQPPATELLNRGSDSVHGIAGFQSPVTTLGLVTSPSSAAYDDVVQVISDRAPWVRVVFAPAAVQAESAAAQMTDAILRLHTCQPAPQVILLCRGGSTEPSQLNTFGDPLLLAAIRASRIRLVTAIGHARDQTPADRVAAASFITPSAAAVALVPDRQQIRGALAEQRQRLEHLLAERLPELESGTRLSLPEEVSPGELLASARARLQRAEERLGSAGLTQEARAELRYTVAADLLLAHALLGSAAVAVTRLD